MIQKIIVVQGEEIPYRLCKRKGMRYMRLSYHPLKGLSVSAPRWYPLFAIENFLAEKTNWISEKMRQFPLELFDVKREQNLLEYRVKKEKAQRMLCDIANQYAQQYRVSFRQLTVRNQRTRWGSCSKARNLSLHYKAAFLPPHLRDYIVVHELCHILEMNHSQRFWNLVAETIPNYKEVKKELKKYRI